MIKIVSGGQTGVDQGALQAALDRAQRCGGWCPEGRKAEDGKIPDRFPVTELKGGGYFERTRRNVIDSDATVLIHFGPVRGGTALTQQFCRETGRPNLAVDASSTDTDTAVARLLSFVREHQVSVLNVAGPRESGAPGAGESARRIVGAFLDQWSG